MTSTPLREGTLDTEHLIHWNGRVVPWVTRWDGDVSDRGIRVAWQPPTKRLRVRHPDGEPEFRDERGVLWQREGLGRKGEPKFAQVNTYRQRASMLKGLCQICGRRINDRPIPWLVPGHMLRHDHDPAGPVTMSTPTCADCIPISLQLCPHLRKADELLVARVLEYQVYGYFGAVVTVRAGEDGPETAIESRILVPLNRMGEQRGQVDPGVVVAQQLAVQFTKFTLSDFTKEAP